jgi:hypothetical protein
MTMGKFMAVVRQATVSRCVAALLALMIFLPFTPPYSTCGLSDLIGEVATDHAPAFDFKLVEDVAASVPILGTLAPLPLNLAFQAFALTAPLPPLALQSEVQRI